VKSAQFAYHAPETLDEALSLLQPEADARVLAGGQSLMAQMKLRRVKPGALVDINRVAGLDSLEVRDGELYVGALVRQQTLLDDPNVAHAWPLIADALRFVGYRTTRHRGTVGGSLAYAAPWAELTAVAVALAATIDVQSARGARSIGARSFFRGPNETALEADELITAVRFPAPSPRTGSAFHEVSVRYRDYAQVAAAAVVELDVQRACTSASLVLLRVAATPFLAEIDSIVLGSPLDEATLGAVSDSLASLEPPDDIEATGSYRRRVAGVLARRALRDAAERAATEERA
jgi:aerobic carbon-monoxide dehydrogenase medium subunit